MKRFQLCYLLVELCKFVLTLKEKKIYIINKVKFNNNNYKNSILTNNLKMNQIYKQILENREWISIIIKKANLHKGPEVEAKINKIFNNAKRLLVLIQQ